MQIDFEALRARPEVLPQKRIVTVRLPEELHSALKDLAHKEKISLNTLAVASLHAQVQAAQPAK
jgi:predicted HicB family RNase H-like nuclease